MNALNHITPLPVMARAPYVDHYDDPFDVTDAWAEMTGDNDVSVEAHFDHNADFGQLNPSLVGVTVRDGAKTTHYSAEGAISILGPNAVIRIEAAYSEVVQ